MNMNNHYLPHIDGYRSIALLGVVLYHLNPDRFQGGFLGVVIFFVLAGFLSTWHHLIHEETTQNINSSVHHTFVLLKKKGQKLLPPLVAMVFITMLYMMWRFPEFLSNVQASGRTSILGINNIWQLLQHRSYFEQMAWIQPFQHLWALSLEMQFYFLFYIAFSRINITNNRKKWMLALLGLAAISYTVSWLIYQPGTDPTRLYYGTDTRLYSFLIGMIGALICYPLKVKLKHYHTTSTINLSAIILLSASIMLMFQWKANPWMFRGGLIVYSLLAMLTIYTLLSPTLWISPLLVNPFTRYLSTRSYELFLWHVPVFQIVQKELVYSNLPPVIYNLLLLGISWIAAELSHQLFQKKYRHRWIVTLLLIIGILCFPAPTKIVQNTALEQLQEELNKNHTKSSPKYTSEHFAIPEDHLISVPDAIPVPQPIPEEIEQRIQMGNERFPSVAIDARLYSTVRNSKNILIIGDSMSLMAYEQLHKFFPHATIDTAKSRPMQEAANILSMHRSQGQEASIVVFALGTNGPPTHESIDAGRAIDDAAHFILTTIVLPFQNQEKSRNKMIISYIEEHPEVDLVDWHKYAKNHAEFFSADDIHPSYEGAWLYAHLIAEKIISALTK